MGGEKPDTPEKMALVTESWVDLKLKAFRAEVRLLVVISLLANQVFAHVAVPKEVAVGALAAVAGKLLLVR